MSNHQGSRREFLKYAAAAGAWAGFPRFLHASTPAIQSHKENVSKAKPNVILILADDQGYGDLSANPHRTAVSTPNIERLAKEGILFTDGYACASMCLPSRAGIMSGRYPGRLGLYDVGVDALVGLPKGEKIAPEYFKELGYATGLIGKWHLGGEVEEFSYNYPLNKGFDRFWGFIDSTHDYWKADTGSGINSGGYTSCGRNPIYDQHREVESIEYLTHEINHESLKFIEEHRRQPFFLYVAHHCPHPPLQVPRDVHGKYEKLGYGDSTTITRAMYDVMDEGIGLILDKLDELGISENTLIIYSSDNGGGEGSGQLNADLRGGKFNFLEGGIRVPTILRWPARLPQNRVYKHPMINIDFLPTALAATGAEQDPKFEGVNLLPFLSGGNEVAPHPNLCWSLPQNPPQYAIREGDWKLVYTKIGYGLFNLRQDPGEANDLREKHPDVAQRLLEHWEEWNSKNIPKRWTPELLDKYWTSRPPKDSRDAGSFRYSSTFGE